MAEKLSSAARVLHDEPIAFHLHGEGLQLVQHDPPDALSTKVGGNHKIIDPYGVAANIDRQHGNELANKLTDQTARWNLITTGVGGHKSAHFGRVRCLDWPYKQVLPPHG